jgi:hypothetical protein
MASPATLRLDFDFVDNTTIFRTAQLSHFSVKEYLVSPRASFWHLDEQQSHVAIIQTLTTYYILVASMPDFSSLSQQDNIIEHSLAVYAASETYRHLTSLESREHPNFLASFRALLNPNSRLLCTQIGSLYLSPGSLFISIIQPMFFVIPQIYAPGLSLCAAATLGLPNITKWLLSFDICCDQLLCPLPIPDDEEPIFQLPKVPLSVAAYHGLLDVVKVLLGAGADTHESMRHAIYFAASCDRREVMQVLLMVGGDPNATEPRGEDTALYEAAFWGYMNIMKMLLNAGANVNAIGGRYGSAIQAASRTVRSDSIRQAL